MKQPRCPCPLPSPHPSDYPIFRPELEVTGHSGGAEQRTLRLPERWRHADPTASEELFQKDGLLLALYTTMETSQPPKPTGLARGAEIWRLQKAHMSQSWIAGKCWESQIGVHFGGFGPGKCIFSCRRKLVCKTKAEPGPKSKHHLPEWRWNLIVGCTKFLSKSHLQLPWHVFKVVTGRTVI